MTINLTAVTTTGVTKPDLPLITMHFFHEALEIIAKHVLRHNPRTLGIFIQSEKKKADCHVARWSVPVSHLLHYHPLYWSHEASLVSRRIYVVSCIICIRALLGNKWASNCTTLSFGRFLPRSADFLWVLCNLHLYQPEFQYVYHCQYRMLKLSAVSFSEPLQAQFVFG